MRAVRARFLCKQRRRSVKIGGFMKQSFVDFPATMAAVIFTSGCNLNCWYCHNRQLIDGKQEEISLQEIFDFLESRKTFLDGVVISGGEPTLQSDLHDVIKELKKRGFKVKLDTNGTNPRVLKAVLPDLDYVAMDVKNSLENYHKTVGCVNTASILESINILKSGNCDYEFRLTFSPDVSFEDIEKIGQLVSGCKKFALQTYNPQALNHPKQLPENYQKALNILKKYVFGAFLR